MIKVKYWPPNPNIFFWKLLINTKYTFVYIIHFYRSVYCEILENRGIQALHETYEILIPQVF